MSGLRVSVVAVQTPCSFFSMARRWPMPVTKTSLALGARRRKVTLPSAETSGDLMGGAPRPGAWARAALAAARTRIAVVSFMKYSENDYKPGEGNAKSGDEKVLAA